VTNVNGRGFVSYEDGIGSKRWGLNFSYCTLHIFGVRKGRFLYSQEGSFLALAFNGGGVNVALGLVHYGDIERVRELEKRRCRIP
jgi:hypothetical protein